MGRQLEALGHHVERATPRFDWDEFIARNTDIIALGIVEAVAEVSALTGNEPGPDTLEHAIAALYEQGRRLTVGDLLSATQAVNAISRTVGEFFAQWDLLLTPTVNVPPLPVEYHDANDPSYDAAGWIHRVLDVCSFTPIFNWTGTPALSLPLGWSSDGLPIGVQLAAPMCDEATLIRVGSQLEEAMPWRDRRPAVHVVGTRSGVS